MLALALRLGTCVKACADRLDEELDEQGRLRPEVARKDVSPDFVTRL